MNEVCLLSCESYDPAVLEANVEACFAALHLNELVKPGMQAVVKVNLIMAAKPDSAAITHPAVTAAVGKKLQALGARVLVAESPGGPYSPAVMERAYHTTGYREMAGQTGISLYTACETETLECDGAMCREFTVLKPYLQADLIVDICKIKTHAMMQYSGAVKNMFGCVPGLLKPELHCRFPEPGHFAEMILDLCQAVKPTICFADGITAMEGNGPTGGTPRHLGVLAASQSPYALDVACMKLIGMRVSDVPIAAAAAKCGLGAENAAQLTLLGDDIGSLCINDFIPPKSSSVDFLQYVPKVFRPLAVKLCTPVPKIQQKNCVGCGKCAQSCPQHAISIIEKRARIDYKRCIHCFCCHEMCPQHVIDIRRFRVFNL